MNGNKKPKRLTRKVIRPLLLLSMASVSFSSAYADVRDRESDNQEILDAWKILECGERYKEIWYGDNRVTRATVPDGDSQIGITHSQLVDQYDELPVSNGGDCIYNDSEGRRLNHPKLLALALQTFADLYDSDNLSSNERQQVTWGLQESYNQVLEGIQLQGNNFLAEGLRTRFTDTTTSSFDFLELSENVYSSGLEFITDFTYQYSDVLRRLGDANPRFPFIVNHTTGITTPSEYQQLTNAIERYGLSAITEAQYLFFHDSVGDVDNYPYGNFPGIEDRDLNNNRIIDNDGEIEAAARAKTAGTHVYLQSVALSKMQTTDEFQLNNGYQLKRQVNAANQLYQDIQSGFNPMKLAGDFLQRTGIDNTEITGILSTANTAVNEAVSAERDAREAGRRYDLDQDALGRTLRDNTANYVATLRNLTGLQNLNDYDLLTEEGREDFKFDALSYTLEQKRGEIGLLVHDVESLELQITNLYKQIQNTYERIAIEQDRSNEVIKIVLNTQEEVAALQYAIAIHSCCTQSSGTSLTEGTSNGTSQSKGGSVTRSVETVTGLFTSGASVGFSESVSWSTQTSTGTSTSIGSSEGSSWNPNVEALAQSQSDVTLLQAIERSRVEGTNSAALVKNLLIEISTLYLSIEELYLAKERQLALIRSQFDVMNSVLAQYSVALEDLSTAYFNNPAYRLELSNAEEFANAKFNTAMYWSYRAAKNLEYVWSEKFNNPILSQDNTDSPQAIEGEEFDTFVRAESVFSARFAGGSIPNLRDFLGALKIWDQELGNLRSPNRENERRTFSLRKDILGFEVENPDDLEQERQSIARFKSFIADHRILGLNPTKPDLRFDFSLSIADNAFFDIDQPNLKIQSLSMNLLSDDDGLFDRDVNNAPSVDLAMTDRAYVRTFFANYRSGRDDLLSYKLEEGRTLSDSPFLAIVNPQVDGEGELDENTALAGLSPAVTKWVFYIDSGDFVNQHLLLDNLTDIEFTVDYTYGPPDVPFPF